MNIDKLARLHAEAVPGNNACIELLAAVPALIDCAKALKHERTRCSEADVIGKHPGDVAGRYWWSGGTWLRPGQAVCVIDGYNDANPQP
jgi:hypothetical protein